MSAPGKAGVDPAREDQSQRRSCADVRQIAIRQKPAPKTEGIKLGEAVAVKVLEVRAADGSDAPDAYRPRTTPGVYVPAPITISSMWPNMEPFVIASPSQYRPAPTISLKSKE